MPDLKLAKLLDRTPVKLTIAVFPDLYARLDAYSRAYATAYGSAEPIAELIPAMLGAFLDSDRGFAKSLRSPSTDRS
ncbi:DUF2274 domain-containing protein [Sphingomonas sp. UYEF23]|uniref:DUF2274 domain-containing protein n=1 Tax=Sphingomonas sp. UYEF23 TaxID=1756408 RepID=UPI003394E202